MKIDWELPEKSAKFIHLVGEFNVSLTIAGKALNVNPLSAKYAFIILL